MAKKKGAKKRAERAQAAETVARDPGFGVLNWGLIGAGVALGGLGFLLLSQGGETSSTVLIVLGYCAFVPAGLLLPRDFHRKWWKKEEGAVVRPEPKVEPPAAKKTEGEGEKGA